ncbi:hypothetical protein U879_15910 [Defluviimonas sp. 20V17]|nr:transglycosylase SLT domain-containing protein [Allgaiera indica]KDB02678.1 hypothetical protein U879_15910 [Defluviimonas sp. 20V17]GHE01804.1 lytic transglycosylase [Allgaiera indica]
MPDNSGIVRALVSVISVLDRGLAGALVCAGILLTGATPARAAAANKADLSALCDAATNHAARATGVPVSVLQAISLTETGRRRGGTTRPWPWTVNMEGKGHWFPTRDAALAFIDERHSAGARSFDLGCFQLNYRWHGGAFASFTDMFNPQANALYAARFLRTLYDEFGDWTRAAGAYHSRTPELARRYKARFSQYFTALTGAKPTTEAARVSEGALRNPAPDGGGSGPNRYPLLQAGQSAGLGSIVPRRAPGPSLFAASAPQG